MPGTYQKTVNIDANNNNSANPDFSWVIEPSSADAANGGWVTLSASSGSNGNTTDFEIADQPNGGLERTCTVYARHWNYDNDNSLQDSFTITQSASGVVVTTTLPEFTCSEANPQIAQGVEGQQIDISDVSLDEGTLDGVTPGNYVAGTNDYDVDVIIPAGYQNAGGTITCENISATASATTAPPINYTLTLDSGTNSGQPLQIQEVGSPQAHTIGYTVSPAGAPQIVGNLPAWLTENIAGTNQNSGTIQLQLNPDTSQYPADSQSTTITYKHNGDSSNSSEVTIYVSFIAAPKNSILVSAGATVVSQAPNGEGESTYTDDNAAAPPDQAVTYTLSLDPDATLTSSEVYWSDTLPSTSGHQAELTPYWATALTVNNTPSSGQAQISYSHIDPNSQALSNTPITDESAVAQSSAPGTILTNQMYVIARHPDDTSHWVAILVTAPLQSITTTTTNPVYHFEFTSVLPNSLTGNGLVTASFSWNGPSSINAQDPNGIFTYFSVENPLGPASSSIVAVNPTNGSVTASISEGANNTNGGETLSINFTAGLGYTLDANSVTSIDFTWGPCHVEGTVMNLADGTTKLVEDLQVGDVLASYDIAGLSDAGEWSNYSSQINQFSASSSTATVTSVVAGQHTSYRNFNNGLTKVTSEHPILVKTTGNDILFKQAIDVLVGDSFYTASGWVEITSNELIRETVNTYSIDVETEDVYMADGVLFHNSEIKVKIEE